MGSQLQEIIPFFLSYFLSCFTSSHYSRLLKCHYITDKNLPFCRSSSTLFPQLQYFCSEYVLTAYLHSTCPLFSITPVSLIVLVTIVSMTICHHPQSRPESKMCLLFALMSKGFQVSSLFCLPINPSVFLYLMLHGLSHAFWKWREKKKKLCSGASKRERIRTRQASVPLRFYSKLSGACGLQ